MGAESATLNATPAPSWARRVVLAPAVVLCVMLLLVLTSCGIELPAPLPQSVSPEWAYNGEETRIEISGAAFYPRIEVDSSGRGDAQVDRGFSVALVGPTDQGQFVSRALAGVTLVDFTLLQATINDGLPPGTYDVVVRGPSGATGTLPNGFTLTDTQAQRIVADLTAVSFEVQQVAWLDLTVVDVGGDRVLQDVAVELRAEQGGALMDGAQWDAADLDGSSVDGAAVTGNLGPDGAARVGLIVTEPGLMEVVIEASDSAFALQETRIVLLWEPGSELELDIQSSGVLSVVAGDPLPLTLTVRDQYGNAVSDATEVLLIDACESWYAQVTVEGATTVDAVLTEATGTTSCDEESIVALWGPAGELGPIRVLPAALDRFDVSVFATEAIAGAPLTLLGRPVDAFDNETVWSGDVEALVITDDLGTVLDADCSATLDAVLCDVIPTVSGSRTLFVTADGSSGASSSFEVLPGPPTSLTVAAGATPAVAGAPIDLSVVGFDAWGNAADPAVLPDLVTLEDALGDMVCAGGSALGSAWAFSCTFTRATSSTVVTATLSSSGAAASTTPFPVVNGDVAVVVVEPDAAIVEAGVPMLVLLQAYDAWGNPYLVRPDPDVVVTDSAGAGPTVVVAIGADGLATPDITLTGAGTTQLIVSQGGVELGRSVPIEVSPGAADRLTVSPQVSWGWVGTPTDVLIEAIDAWGNHVDLDELVTVSGSPLAVAAVEGTLVDGVATVALDWVDAGGVRVHAEAASGLDGDSSTFVVAESCPSGGPTATVSYSGRDEAVACFDPVSGQAEVAATVAGVAGTSPILRYGLAVEGGVAVVSASSTVVASTPLLGQLETRVLVQQANGCAIELAGTAWVGEDDGSVVGPIELALDDDVLTVGLEATRVSMTSLTDCAGDVAVGAAVSVRSDRGVLGGPRASGFGPTVTLDATGSASFVLDASGQPTGGAFEVVAFDVEGSAFGAATGTFTGDHRRPFVVDQDPTGDTVGVVDQVAVVFSEPVLVPALDALRLVGPSSVGAVAASVDASGTELLITLEAAVDAAEGAWGVVVDTDLRDLAGNRLDGTWTGTPSTYNGAFGALPNSLSSVDSCLPDTYVFRPDGDDAAGEEADTVVVDVRTARAPFAWLITVRDASGALVHFERALASSSAELLSWDGRDLTERVVPNGAYTIRVDTDDGSGNRGGACTTVATVDNLWGSDE